MAGHKHTRLAFAGLALVACSLLGWSRLAWGSLPAIDAYHIGAYHLRTGDHAKAIEAFSDAIRINPQFVRAYVARGKLYAEQGEHQSAIADLSFAIRLEPKNSEALAFRGYALFRMGDVDSAISDFDQALSIDRHYARVYYLRAQALLAKGDLQGARLNFSTATQLDPTLDDGFPKAPGAAGADIHQTAEAEAAQKAAQGYFMGGSGDGSTPYSAPLPVVDAPAAGSSTLTMGIPFNPSATTPQVTPEADLAMGMNPPAVMPRKDFPPFAGPGAGGAQQAVQLPPATAELTFLPPVAQPSNDTGSLGTTLDAPVQTMPAPAAAETRDPGVTFPSMSTGQPQLASSHSAEVVVPTQPQPGADQEQPIVLPPVTPPPAGDGFGQPAAVATADRSSLPGFGPQPIQPEQPLGLEPPAREDSPQVAAETTADVLPGSGGPALALFQRRHEPQPEARQLAERPTTDNGVLHLHVSSGSGPDQHAHPHEQTPQPTVAAGQTPVTPHTRHQLVDFQREQIQPDDREVRLARAQRDDRVLPDADPIPSGDVHSEPLTVEPAFGQPPQAVSLPQPVQEPSASLPPAMPVSPAMPVLPAMPVQEVASDAAPMSPVVPHDVQPQQPTVDVPSQTQKARNVFDQAVAAEAAGQTEEAIAGYGRALEVDPNFAEAYRRRGWLLLGNRLYEQALADFNEVLRLYPGQATAYYDRGVAYLEGNAPQNAIDDFNVAIRFRPDYREAVAMRAKAYLALQRFDEALADASRMVQLDPTDAQAYGDRGRLNLVLGDCVQAIDDYTAALGFDAERPEFYRARGLAHARMGQLDQAMADYDEALARQPDDPQTYLGRAQIHISLGVFDRAVADLNEAIRLDSNYAMAYYERSRAYAGKGAYHQAHADRNRARQLDPNL